MADALDAAGMAGPPTAAALVNKREVTFNIANGQIVDGPPALVGKWVCLEQMADILSHAGPVIEHLFAVDTQAETRLAEVDYRVARAKENRGEFVVGSHVQYGKHGVFRVKNFLRDEDKYVLVANGREITVGRERLENEAKVIEQGADPVPAAAPDMSRYQPEQVSGEGSIEIDDADLTRLINDWCEAHLPAIIERHLANHRAEGGKDPSVQ